MSPSCGEPSKEMMAEQNARQRTKQLPSMESAVVVDSHLHACFGVSFHALK